MTTPMEICVIIPAYNASQYIDQAINSVVMQTVPITEIIVVDDGSTDNTSEIVKTVAPNVILVKQSNSGPSAARNRGLDLAQGDVVAFLDADDLWLSLIHIFSELRDFLAPLFGRACNQLCIAFGAPLRNFPA